MTIPDDTEEPIETLEPDDLPDTPPDFDPCEEAAGDMSAALGIMAAARTLVSPRQVSLTWLTAAFDKWGVKYRVVTGWQDRGRPPSSGGFDPRGVLVHHTGSRSSTAKPYPALGTVTNGRSDLPGPLCQVSTGYDGVTTIVAAGRANHAGKAKAAAGVPAGDGNALWVGNEVDTNGTQTMPQVQYDAVVLSTAAILDGLGSSAVALHDTTSSSGKWDLGAGDGRFGIPFSVTRLRADVAARLQSGPTTPTGGFLMALTDAQQTDIYNRVMGGIPPGDVRGAKNPDGSPAWVLTSADGDTLRRAIVAAVVDPVKIATAVAAAMPSGSTAIDDAQLERVLRRVLGSVDDVPA